MSGSLRLTLALVGTLGCFAAWADPGLRIGTGNNHFYRGLLQTHDGIAWHALLDYQMDNGFYAGVWTARVSYPQDERSLQTDLFAGWQKRWGQHLATDISLVRYRFDRDTPRGAYDWSELQLALHVMDRWTVLLGHGRDWLGQNAESQVAELTYRHPLPLGLILDVTRGEHFTADVVGERYAYSNVGLSRAFRAVDVRLGYNDLHGASTLERFNDGQHWNLRVSWTVDDDWLKFGR